MDEQPLNNIFEKAAKELRSSVTGTLQHLQKGMLGYLTERMQKMGIPSMVGMGGTPVPGMDYYKILGLDKTASDDEVKERYRVIMKKLHPDKSGDELTFLAGMVNIAYGIICKERGI